jgi:hypothetical protein
MSWRSDLVRLFVILTSITFGIAASVGYVAVAIQGIVNPPPILGVPARPTPAENLMFFEACMVFYSVVYAVGAFTYRTLGARNEQASVLGVSEQHLPVLHLAGALEMLGFHTPKFWNGTATAGDMLSLAAGVVFLCAAIVGLGRAIRKYHPFGLGYRRESRD